MENNPCRHSMSPEAKRLKLKKILEFFLQLNSGRFGHFSAFYIGRLYKCVVKAA